MRLDSQLRGLLLGNPAQPILPSPSVPHVMCSTLSSHEHIELALHAALSEWA